MKAVGIIAEYNPFHSGHAYHIQKTREISGADYAVIIMSGDFVQRGAPAIVDKYTRTRMALQGGADLVIELPVCAAVSSAETFARTGVSLLTASGIVSHLSFGAETDDLPALWAIADLFAGEPASYRNALQAYVKQGETFPTARARAAAEYFAAKGQSSPSHSSLQKVPGSTGETSLSSGKIMGILRTPNNILAIEYLKAIRQTGSALLPVLVRRQGDYHAANLNGGFSWRENETVSSGVPSAKRHNPRFSSAAAIRRLILQAWDSKAPGSRPSGDRENNSAESLRHLLTGEIPPESLTTLLACLSEFPPLCEDDFSAQLHYRLLQRPQLSDERNTEKRKKQASDAALKRRIENLSEQFTTYSAFTDLIKTRNRTRTCVSRTLTRMLLGISGAEDAALRREQYAPYLRVLGFRESAAPLLAALRQSGMPVILSLKKEVGELNTDQKILLNADIRAAGIYRSELTAKTGCPLKNEFRSPVETV